MLLLLIAVASVTPYHLRLQRNQSRINVTCARPCGNYTEIWLLHFHTTLQNTNHYITLTNLRPLEDLIRSSTKFVEKYLKDFLTEFSIQLHSNNDCTENGTVEFSLEVSLNNTDNIIQSTQENMIVSCGAENGTTTSYSQLSTVVYFPLQDDSLTCTTGMLFTC